MVDQVTKDRTATTAGVFVGDDSPRSPQIVGVISTLEGGVTGAMPWDETRWIWVHEVLDKLYDQRELIGWYIARPGVMAMPTETDAAVHFEYFGAPEHVLLCLDPTTSVGAAYRSSAEGGLHEISVGDLKSMLRREDGRARRS